MRTPVSLISVPKVSLETTPVLVWLITDMDCFRFLRVKSRPLPLSLLQAIIAVMVWGVLLQKSIKLVSASALPNRGHNRTVEGDV